MCILTRKSKLLGLLVEDQWETIFSYTYIQSITLGESEKIYYIVSGKNLDGIGEARNSTTEEQGAG